MYYDGTEHEIMVNYFKLVLTVIALDFRYTHDLTLDS